MVPVAGPWAGGGLGGDAGGAGGLGRLRAGVGGNGEGGEEVSRTYKLRNRVKGGVDQRTGIRKVRVRKKSRSG